MTFIRDLKYEDRLACVWLELSHQQKMTQFRLDYQFIILRKMKRFISFVIIQCPIPIDGLYILLIKVNHSGHFIEEIDTCST